MSTVKIISKNLPLKSGLKKNLLKISLFLLASVSSLSLSTIISYSSEDLTPTSPSVSRPLNAEQTRLLKAVEEGKYDEVEELLLDNQSLIDSKDKRQNSLLHLAIQRGHQQIVGFLLDEKCDVKTVNRYGRTPLHEAILKADKNTIERLLKKAVDVNAQDQEGNTALHIAIDQQSLDSVLLLMNEISFNPLIKNAQGKTAGDLIEQQIRAIDKDASVARTLKSHFSRFSNVRVRSVLEQEVNLTSSHYDLAKQIMQQDKRIFFSYCWSTDYSTKPMVEDLENILKDLGITNYYRDVREEEGFGMTVGTHIETFMQNAQQAEAVVIFLNDAYLRSRNCMYEFLQVWEEDKKRISPKVFVIRHPDFNTLFGGPSAANIYAEYWNENFKKLKEAPDTASNRVWNLKEQALVERIQRQISSMIEQLTSHIQADYRQVRSEGFESILHLCLKERESKFSPNVSSSLSSINLKIENRDEDIHHAIKSSETNSIPIRKDFPESNRTSAQSEGIIKNEFEAIKYYKAGAEQGDADTQWALASLYLKNGFWEEGLKWTHCSAEQDNVYAQTALAAMYAEGHGVKKTLNKAIEWYRRAAEQGHADAQCNLGLIYIKDEGIKRDVTEALKWFKLAAHQGHLIAQRNVGIIYAKGYGVLPDYNEAIKYYKLGAEQGDADTQWALGSLCIEKELWEEGLKWVRCAAEQNNVYAQTALAAMYAEGHGVKKDLNKAIEWYRRAAERGHADAQCNLGLIYIKGEAIKKDEKEALKWFKLAAQQGHLLAQRNVGIMYAKGYQAPKEEKKREGCAIL